TVTGLPASEVRFSGHEQLIVNAGSGNDVLTLASSTSVVTPVSFDGGAGSDTVEAAAADHTLLVTGLNEGRLSVTRPANGVTFSKTENLLGNAGNDRFVFLDGAQVSGSVDGRGGIDTLDYSPSTAAVSIDLSGTASRAGGISSIENAIGGSGADVIKGSAAD